jgi:hypothetical protein
MESFILAHSLEDSVHDGSIPLLQVCGEVAHHGWKLVVKNTCSLFCPELEREIKEGARFLL